MAKINARDILDYLADIDGAGIWMLWKILISLMFRNRCAACGARDHLEGHHNTYRGDRGGEEAGDCIPLCWGCHPIFEWLRSGASEFFKAFVWNAEQQTRRLRGGDGKNVGRMHASLEQVQSWAEGTYRRAMEARIAEVNQHQDEVSAEISELEYEVAKLSLLQPNWNGEKGVKKRVFPRRADGEERRAA